MDDTDERTCTQVDVDPDLAQKLLEAKAAFDEVRDYYEGLRDEMASKLRERAIDDADVIEGVSDGITIVRVTRYASSTFDRKKFRSAYPDIYHQFTTDRVLTRVSFPARGSE